MMQLKHLLRRNPTDIRSLLCLIAGVVMAACQPQTATPTSSEPVVEARLLATVYISPTPDAAQVQATQLASRPTSTAPLPTMTPSATPYIGVFLGEAESAGEGDIPIVNPTLFAGELGLDIPTEGALACPVQSDPVFGVNWSADPTVAQALGCPAAPSIQFNGTVQVFERGVMYWRGDTGEIWAIAPGVSGAGRFWFVAQALPAEETPISAPEGLRVPTMGFGNVWRGTAGVRDALGFARTDEQPASFLLQRYEGGTLLIDGSSGQVFALVGRETAYGPY